MEDSSIIALYFARDERALAETAGKYGAFCRRIADHLLAQREDAEECVNDTWHAAWMRIPPAVPQSLRAFLGRITRDLAISRLRAREADKRGGGALLAELDECVPAAEDVQRALERRELSEVIGAWLRAQTADDRALFLRRYWYGDAVRDLARERGATANGTAQRLRRLRASLRRTLEAKGAEL